MKAYGKERTFDAKESQEGLKSSHRNVEGKGGDIRNSYKSVKVKNKIRKTIKTAQRKQNKEIIDVELDDNISDFEDKLLGYHSERDEFYK